MTRSLSSLLLVAALLPGCADHAMDVPGSEALIYAEQHRFDLTPRNRDGDAMAAKISAIAAQFDADRARFTLHHGPGWQRQAQRLRQRLIGDGINPQRIALQSDPTMAPPISLRVAYWQTRSGECRQHRLDQPYPRLGCAVDANRLSHTRHPDTLARGDR